MAFHIDGVTYIPKGRWPNDGERSNQLILIRLLIGLIHIEKGGEKVNQSTDFSIVPPRPQVNTPGRGFQEFSGRYSLGVSQSKLISSTVSANRLFFQDLLGEFSNYFFQTKRNAHTAAFVFLYRALERISYSVPLLYNSISNDFFGTFNDMKALFSNKDGAGELGLFKKFLNQGRFIDPVILDTAYTIPFSSQAGYASKYFDVATLLYSGFSSQDSTTSTVEIRFRDIPELFVPLRNRFFHFRTGDWQTNIAIRDIHDSDEFFSAVNCVFCSFLAVVSLHAVAATCNR